jgi:biopolymer transport protein ExbB/TolQ
VSQSNRLAQLVLRWPVLWGGLAALAFYSLIRGQILSGPFVERYFASHPVEYVETTMFFVALAALLLKVFDIAAQSAMVQKPLIEPPLPEGERPEECAHHLSQLAALPESVQQGYLVRRLREAMLHVRRKGSADMLDDHLRYLSDLDSARMQGGYGLVRIILWAIPILGFLGTVIGITLAIAELTSLEQMESLVANLSIAFDTTALALALSIPLMFARHWTEAYETRLLEAVDARVDAELIGRFQQLGSGTDPAAASIRITGQRVIETTQELVERQAALWQRTIDAAHEHWSRLAQSTSHHTEQALAAALDQSLQNHAERTLEAERVLAEENRRHWQKVTDALVLLSETMAGQQRELSHQGEVLLQVVQATGQVARLEDELNRNLHALAGAKNFEETVTSLAAAIQLLSSRLGAPPASVPVELTRTKSRNGQAA